MNYHSSTRSDDGFAVITAVLTTLVVLSLSLVALGVATHNSEASAYDRDRVRAVHAAEAGVNGAMARVLKAGSAAAAPCLVDGTTTAQPVSSFAASITYYSTWPLDPTTVIPCVGDQLLPDAAPLGAVIDSTGRAGKVERRMETATRLSPAYGGALDKAIFADGTLAMSNKIVIEGDVYTNENWTCPNNVEINGSLYGQGSAHMSNTCRVRDDLHVVGDITLENKAVVGSNAISSTGTITLRNDSRIGADVYYAIECVGCVAPRVDEGRLFPTASAPPEPESLDVINYVPGDWSGYEIEPVFSGTDACTDARASILDPTSAPRRVVRITEVCKLTFDLNTNVVLPDNLAIITDGSIEFVNHGVWTTPDASTRDLFLIVPYDAPGRHGTTCSSGLHDIVKSNNTDFDHLHFLVYTPCRAVFANNNPSSSGQVYAGDVMLDNNFALDYHSMLVPGMDATTVVGFSSQVAYIREINTTP